MQSRLFRIEKNIHQNTDTDPCVHKTTHDQHRQVMTELEIIKSRLKPYCNEEDDYDQVDHNLVYSAEDAGGTDKICEIEGFEDVLILRAELKEIHDAIENTKKEILSLYQTGAGGSEIARVSTELSAIVNGTESATEAILSSAESIDHLAANLVASLRQESENSMASDIQDQVIKIFEACNFQDITGQRISKVVKTFSFVEVRVKRMMEIWGGINSFEGVEPDPNPEMQGDKALLNGPALDSDAGVANQEDIDAIFD